MTLSEIKVKLIEAHRNQDWEAAKILSQLKEKAKKYKRYCPICGRRCTRDYCEMHSRLHRYHSKHLPYYTVKFTEPVLDKKALRKLELSLKRKQTSIDTYQDRIVALIAQSHTRTSIAKDLHLSLKTIDYHLKGVAKRLNTTSNDVAAFTRYAIIKGLITLCFMLLVGCKTSTAVYSPLPVPTPPVHPLVAMMAVSAPTNNVTLGWDYDTNTPGLQKFTLYQGSISKQYTNIYDFSIALMGAAYANPSTNYFNLTATVNNFESPFSGEISYTPVIKPVLLYIDTFVQTNSTLNSNLWGNVMQFSTVILTNPPNPIFGRTLIQMNYH